MILKSTIRAILGASSLAVAFPALAQEAEETVGIEEIIVTAQKREESVQSVPIAVTALTADALTTQRINLAEDLPRVVPNLYYARAGIGFNETNFQLRGIGYQLVSTSGDGGVGVHVNNAPLGVNRMGQSEMYDMERVEVLRGPQGTLYGRNATGGVINLITAKPSVSALSGQGTLELGSYEQKRLSGYLNIPMGDAVALRLAGFGLQRNGYTTNLINDEDVDGRQMVSGRGTLAINPDGRFRAMLMWEHSLEDDDRMGTSKSLCIKDPGPTSVGGVTINSAQARQFLNQGCLPGSIYSDAAYGSVNYVSTLSGQLGSLAGLVTGDAYAGVVQSRDLREVAVTTDPSYESSNDLYELNLEFDITESLTLTALSARLEDKVDTRYSDASYVASTTFNPGPVTPGGYFDDPQSGNLNTPNVVMITDQWAEQFSQELRLQSRFEGSVNFNIGGLYMKLERLNDLYIVPNTQNAYVQLANLANLSTCMPTDCYYDGGSTPDGTGHNYYLSRNPYELTASAIFGEVYWDVTDSFTLTTGLRYTDDKKQIRNHPITMLTPGRGWPETGPLSIIDQEAQWKEVTGRVNAAWRPTEQNLLYVSYSKGYKGGGINPPDASNSNLSTAYEPEFVNAYEIGSKNELFDGRVQANATAFYYDYEGYQISNRRGLSVSTENVDAGISGLELEGVWQVTQGLRMNATIGLLNTELKEGASIDQFDRTQGDPNLTLVKSTSTACVVPTAAMAQFVTLLNNGTPFIPVTGGGTRAATAQDILGICGGSFAAMGLTPSGGVAVDLKGNALPQAPDVTASVGGEYEWHFANGWSTRLRADYYLQSDSFTRVLNTESDKLEGWDNASASLAIFNDRLGWNIQVYGKNLMDDDVITGFDPAPDGLGMVRSVSVLDPRLLGVSITKSF
ncbi:outer membrane receptor protein involved in Fe transport [Povalibacter uvarum]|uniref:Outer membrane receptor protein involved in Fe transport n=1 Tax=Povalibacter uvarum TaxID=732238 RepID=A0A841HJB5_9GAMM|nr:TonB-dependent receptor [Povalibacter uvarum]MBB6093311.1 outer membrane receptor protein involved in Fe transport [Povalibacter uvarum]